MKQSLNFFLLLTAIILLPSWLFAQRTISGLITDAESGEPLLGANIVVEGTSIGTITDFDGNYSLEVPEGFEKLIVSYTGYASKTITLGAANQVDISLAAGELLDEVVVIGYGTVKREDATGSVQTVSTKEFNIGAITGPQELIAGKVAGVSITPAADPGGGATIRIRGGSSLSASNDPLIVIDGVPLSDDGISGSRNPLNIVNPNDIETFTVLKDASATAIYGSRASNGVIIITTKKGSLGNKVRVNYTANFSISETADRLDVLSANEFRGVIEERFPDDVGLLGNTETDWQDEIFQSAFGTDHLLGVSGSVGVFPYRVSLGYTNKEGILRTDDFERYSGSLNVSPGFLDNTLQLNFGIKANRIDNRFANRGAIGSALAFDPTKPVFDDNSQFGGYTTWTDNDGNPIPIAPANPVALLEQREDISTVNRVILNGSADYRFWFLPELRANLNLALDYSETEGSITVPEDAAFEFDAQNGGGTKRDYFQEKENQLFEFYLNYVKDIGNSTLDVMGGYSWQYFFREDRGVSTNFARTRTTNEFNSNPSEYYLVSLFGRLNYSIADRYLFTFTIRQDGTSRFSEDNRLGVFPAAAFAWKAFDNPESNALSTLKVRLGYGITGQQRITDGFLADYPYIAAYTLSTDDAQYQFGDTFFETLRPEGYNENLKWEETTTYNAAVDFGFWKNRVTGTVEVYYRLTEDLLQVITLPSGSNLTNQLLTNVGELENRGVEFTINTTPYIRGNNSWDFGFNVTYNENEITKLTAIEDPNFVGFLDGGISGGVGNTIRINSVGQNAQAFYVFEQVYDEAGNPIEGVYVDRNGDGEVTTEDLYSLDGPAPDVFIGLTTRFQWGNFDIATAGRANIGNSIYNNNLSTGANFNGIQGTGGFLRNTLAAVNQFNFAEPQLFSDIFVVDGSFFRLDHITVGYNFNALFGQSSSLRLFATVQNPFVITDYEGLDPEVFGGIDNNVYPRSRTYLLGVNANF